MTLQVACELFLFCGHHKSRRNASQSVFHSSHQGFYRARLRSHRHPGHDQDVRGADLDFRSPQGRLASTSTPPPGLAHRLRLRLSYGGRPGGCCGRPRHVSGARALFGADLEEEDDAWALASDTVERLELGTATILKVPHHGARNGELGAQHDRLVSTAALCATTTFVPGVATGTPPHREVVERLRDRGTTPWIIGPIRGPWAQDGDPPPGRLGHLQARVDAAATQIGYRRHVRSPAQVEQLLG